MSENPVPPPESEGRPKWAGDSLAKQEERHFDDPDELRGQRTKNDIQWLKVWGIVLVVFLLLFVALFAASLVVWCWHYIAPANLGWLNADQLSKIQSTIFSGSLGAIVSFVAQKQLSK